MFYLKARKAGEGDHAVLVRRSLYLRDTDNHAVLQIYRLGNILLGSGEKLVS